ncbi:MAG: carbohydrate ABC transporter permease, partial [Spirochaetaceae bacterium]|nr:carbohydrate ABC transporter permease [Spirochaetaceae bacterium]
MFDIGVKAALLAWGLVTAYPIWYVIVSSLSSGSAVDIGAVWWKPIGLNLDSYRHVLGKSQFWVSYGNTFFYTIAGTAYSLMISTTAAYALSRRAFRARKILNLALSFTLWFQAGFIPLYLNFRSLGVINSRWGIVVSFGVQAFNIILMRNYFESLPKELDEA